MWTANGALDANVKKEERLVNNVGGKGIESAIETKLILFIYLCIALYDPPLHGA